MRYNYFFNKLSKIALFLEESSQRGSLGKPKSKPKTLRAYLTGIGLTSQKRAEIRGNKSNCKFLESAKLPSKKEATILWVSKGLILDKTEITPIPPKDKIGRTWSSFPE